MQPPPVSSPPTAGPVPPLTEPELGRLQTASDGADHRETAFDALVEHANYWPPIDRATLYLPDAELDLLLSQPSLHRGRPYKIRGRLEQKEVLAPPYATISRWFVRERTGRPLMVFVCGPLDPDGFEIGSTVEIPVRFYKRIDAVAQDDRRHSYPAFVGARPIRIGGASFLVGPLKALSGVIAALLVMGIVLTWRSRRTKPSQLPRSQGEGRDEGSGEQTTPDTAVNQYDPNQKTDGTKRHPLATPVRPERRP